MVEVDLLGDGRRAYTIGSVRIAAGDMLHIRYRSTVDNARGTGPLDAIGRARMVAAAVLLRYLTNFVQGGAVPSGVLEAEEELTAKRWPPICTPSGSRPA